MSSNEEAESSESAELQVPSLQCLCIRALAIKSEDEFWAEKDDIDLLPKLFLRKIWNLHACYEEFLCEFDDMLPIKKQWIQVGSDFRFDRRSTAITCIKSVHFNDMDDQHTYCITEMEDGSFSSLEVPYRKRPSPKQNLPKTRAQRLLKFARMLTKVLRTRNRDNSDDDLQRIDAEPPLVDTAKLLKFAALNRIGLAFEAIFTPAFQGYPVLYKFRWRLLFLHTM